MRYIYKIDELTVRTFVDGKKESVLCRPSQGYGLLKIEIRLRMAWACLIGKADAVEFEGQ